MADSNEADSTEYYQLSFGSSDEDDFSLEELLKMEDAINYSVALSGNRMLSAKLRRRIVIKKQQEQQEHPEQHEQEDNIVNTESSMDSFDQWDQRSYASEKVFEVTVEDQSHKMFPIDLYKTEATVRSLKAEFSLKPHRLLFEGKDLDDDMMVYGNIPPNSVLQMVLTVKSISMSKDIILFSVCFCFDLF